jgi:uncharacterized repeat protein (TIGR03803 family)
MNGRARRRMRLLAATALAAACACTPAGAAPLANLPQITYAFTGGNTGAQPSTGLVLGADGYFYGTNASSAAANSEIVFDYWGGVYRVKPDGSGFQMLHTFTGNLDGGLPNPVLLAADGTIYGTSSTGALGHKSAAGTLWKLVPGGAFSVLRTFDGATGANPGTALVQDETGTLYGATGGGGGGGHGVIYSVRPDGSDYTVLHQFADDADGGTPIGLTLGRDGALYGVNAQCYNCGTENYGAAFTLARDGSGFKVLHRFDPAAGEGRNPHSGLVQVGSYFYGTTNGGGKYGDDAGTVYRFDAKGHFNTVTSFKMLLDGAYPTAPLIVGANGNLYGTTTAWGPDQQSGTLYEITTKGVLVGVESLAGLGTQAQAGLAIGPDARLYTPLLAGGPWQAGAIVSAGQDFDKPVPPAPTVQMTLNAQPPVITLGQTVTLTWQSQGAKSCVASGAWSGAQPLAGSQAETPAAVGQYAYTLTCTNAGGSTAVTDNLFVNAAQ